MEEKVKINLMFCYYISQNFFANMRMNIGKPNKQMNDVETTV